MILTARKFHLLLVILSNCKAHLIMFGMKSALHKFQLLLLLLLLLFLLLSLYWALDNVVLSVFQRKRCVCLLMGNGFIVGA